MMKIVLDTNSLLVSISKNSKYRPIFNAVIHGKIKLLISNDIISEYAEKLAEKTSEIVAFNISEFWYNPIMWRKLRSIIVGI